MFNGNQRVSRETIFVFFLLLSFLFGNQARPTFSKQLAAKDYQMAKVLNYLTQYGYISETKNNQKLHDVQEAIKKFQKTFKLNATGFLDRQTVALMKTPRCGLPDFPFELPLIYKDCKIRKEMSSLDQRKSMKRERICKTKAQETRRKKRFQLMGKWPTTRLTYGFLSFTDKMSKAQQQREIANAFKVWSEGTPLTFERRENEKVDIALSFQRGIHGDGYPFDGPGKTLAHAFFPGSDTINGAVHFDADEPWTNPTSPNGTDLQAVAIHEFGHALGLGHSRSPGSVMQPYYHTRKRVPSLGEDDRRAVNMLYGENLARDDLVSNQERVSVVETPFPPQNNGYTDGPECDMEFDAVANIRKEIFFFKAQNKNPFLRPPFIYGFYFCSTDRNLTAKDFDSSRIQFWSYTNYNMDKNYPKLISEFGLPTKGKIDAAFVWKNVTGETYFIQGNKYWKYEKESPSRIAYGYPKYINETGMVPKINGAFSNPDDSEVYFLKGKYCWKLDRNTLKVIGPERIGVKWFGCKPKKIEPEKRVFKTSNTKQKTSIVKQQTANLPPSSRQLGKAKDNSENGTKSNLKFNLFGVGLSAVISFVGKAIYFK